MRTFAILNMKGGVGKTTTAINLAYLLAMEYQQRVLLIDADGQCNATRTLLPNDNYSGLAALLLGEGGCYDEYIVHTDIFGLDMIPATTELWAVDRAPTTGARNVYLTAIRDARDSIMEDNAYDVIIVDCPPTFSPSCAAAIVAANSIIIPVLPDAFSAEGMAELVSQIDGVREIQPDVRIAGCLINQWHRADVVEDATEYLRAESPVPVYDTVIRRTDKVLESTWAKQPVLMWSPQSSAGRDFRTWAKELVVKEALINGR